MTMAASPSYILEAPSRYDNCATDHHSLLTPIKPDPSCSHAPGKSTWVPPHLNLILTCSLPPTTTTPGTKNFAKAPPAPAGLRQKPAKVFKSVSQSTQYRNEPSSKPTSYRRFPSNAFPTHFSEKNKNPRLQENSWSDSPEKFQGWDAVKFLGGVEVITLSFCIFFSAIFLILWCRVFLL